MKNSAHRYFDKQMKGQFTLSRSPKGNNNVRKAQKEDPEMFDNYDDILTVAEVMDLLYVGKNTVYRLLNEGELNGFRIGRTWKIPRDSLTEFIMTRRAESSIS